MALPLEGDGGHEGRRQRWAGGRRNRGRASGHEGLHLEEGPSDDVEDMMNVRGAKHMHPLNGPDEQETALRSGRLGRQLTLSHWLRKQS